MQRTSRSSETILQGGDTRRVHPSTPIESRPWPYQIGEAVSPSPNKLYLSDYATVASYATDIGATTSSQPARSPGRLPLPAGGQYYLTSAGQSQKTTPLPSPQGPASQYRYASVERLAQRQRIYDPPAGAVSSLSTSSIDLHNHLAALSAKRELFFRDSPTSNGTTAAATNSTTTATAVKGEGTVAPHLTTSLALKEYGKDAKDLEGYVGFANLPNQVYRKAVKRGFDFTLMVVGEAGLGKSTLINSMFLTDIYSNEYPGPSRRLKKTVQVESSKILLKENGVNLTVTIVDTPGFGDAVDNSECWSPIINHIESRYEEYLNAESRVHRTSIPDSRVHCCLYFIAPSGHGLKPLDVEFMKRLHDKVNIIPLIAKADTMTPEECSLFKRTILNEITENNIRIYEFPDCDDEEENKQQKALKERVPFAVVGSNVVLEVNGKKVRGRKYPWGVAEVENMEHCDFIALRNMLVRTHMQDLKDVTNNVHYENYRYRKLAGVGEGKQNRLMNKNPLAQMEEEKKEHVSKMKRMEQEMEQVFEMKVREKMQKLKDSEGDLQRRHEQMKKSLEAQRLDLEEKRRAFEKERSMFDLANKDLEDAFRRMSSDTNSRETLDGKEKKKEKKKGLF